MEKFIKDNGLMGSSMGQVFGKEQKETPMLVSGNSERQTATECTLGSMEIVTKASSKNV